jgi:hypothetical protein
MLFAKQWYSPGPGNDLVKNERFSVAQQGDLWLAFRATNPGPGWAVLNLTALRQGVVVWRDTFLGWIDEFHKPRSGIFAPHTVDRVKFEQQDSTLTDPWGSKPAADPIGPDVRTMVFVWPDQEGDLFHVYPIKLPTHDTLDLEVDINMAGDNGKVRVALGIWVNGHQRYTY